MLFYFYINIYDNIEFIITKGSSRGATLSFTLRSKGEGGQPCYLILQEIVLVTPPLFLFRPNTYIGTCMSIEHIYMRPSRLKNNPVDKHGPATGWVKQVLSLGKTP